jgi:hypothetical protein
MRQARVCFFRAWYSRQRIILVYRAMDRDAAGRFFRIVDSARWGALASMRNVTMACQISCWLPGLYENLLALSAIGYAKRRQSIISAPPRVCARCPFPALVTYAETRAVSRSCLHVSDEIHAASPQVN